MIIETGEIDSATNPFVHESWIKQCFRFTPKRQGQLEPLFGRSVENIMISKPENENRYVAFVGIRLGFATIIYNKLTPADKWVKRLLYDRHGRPLEKI
jgi:hypothetical protein